MCVSVCVCMCVCVCVRARACARAGVCVCPPLRACVCPVCFRVIGGERPHHLVCPMAGPLGLVSGLTLNTLVSMVNSLNFNPIPVRIEQNIANFYFANSD